MWALHVTRSDHQEELLRNVVEAAQDGGLPAVGYAVAHPRRVVWAVALQCGMAALLSPFQVVSHDVPPGGITGVGVHVAHPPSKHGPAAMATSGHGDLILLGGAHGDS